MKKQRSAEPMTTTVNCPGHLGKLERLAELGDDQQFPKTRTEDVAKI